MRRWIVNAAIAHLLTVTTAARAQPTNDCAATLEKARQDMLALYPAGAKAAGVEGSATITCDGTLRNAKRVCKVATESPPDQGFGKAAMMIESATQDNAETPSTNSRAGQSTTVSLAFRLSPPAIMPNEFALATVGHPKWRSSPSGDDIDAALSKAGVRRSLSGRITLLCELADSGRMRACAVTEETPAGAGFGRAAMLLASRFEMSSTTNKGCPVGGLTVNIPIQFRSGG